MYRCYNPKRFCHLLLTDCIVILFWVLCTLIGKAVSVSKQPEKEGIFLPVLMYHSITDSNGSQYRLPVETLTADLEYLKNAGYETVTVKQLIQYTNGVGELPEHPILLTFDDGFYNNLSQAAPLLKRFGMCGVVNPVGYFTDVTAEQDPHVDAYSYLTWDDLRELQASGCMEIGSHTYNLHTNAERAGCAIMYGENPESYQSMLREDLQKMQEEMRENLGTGAVAFAYPFGFVCNESLPVLRELGFQCTMTCYEKPNYIVRNPECLFGLNRYHRNPEENREDFFKRVLEK